MIADKTDLGEVKNPYWVPRKAALGTFQQGNIGYLARQYRFSPFEPHLEVVAQKVTKISSICLSRMVMPRDRRRQPTKLECGSGALSTPLV